MLGPADSVTITTRVEPQLRELLERQAHEEDRSLSATVRHHLRLATANAGDGKKESQ